MTPPDARHLAEYWPLFGLRLATPRLALTPLGDADIVELVDLILAGIHDPAEMPFAMPWTQAPREELILNSIRHFWQVRSQTAPTSWTLSFSVRKQGLLVGLQDLSARDFAAARVVHTGSWLGRAHQGQGIGTEMRCGVLDFAFDHLKAVRAESGAFIGQPVVVAGVGEARLPAERHGSDPSSARRCRGVPAAAGDARDVPSAGVAGAGGRPGTLPAAAGSLIRPATESAAAAGGDS